MNKWYDSLSPSTKQYLQGRTIWTDQDLAKFTLLAFIAGVVAGMVA
jgi:hypothetical protein